MNETPSPVFDDRAHDEARYGGAEPGRFAFGADTTRDVADWQAAFRPALREALGLAVMDEDLAGYAPRAERLGCTPCDGYDRESWVLWTEPTLPLPFYVLRPGGVRGARPLVLTPHGHNEPGLYVGLASGEAGEASIRDGQRDVAVQAVREGYLVIAPTTRGFGDTRTAVDRDEGRLSSCRLQLLHGLLAGRTAIGERVWDMSALLDWALEELPVDAARVAMTGNSGGGTVTLFAAACDERITVAIPSCFFCTFKGSIGSIFHCDCNYVPGMLRLGEMADVAGLIAPRPFCAIAGKDDGIFPIEHVRTAFDALQTVYEAAGVPERCRLFVGEGGHRYYSDGAWPFLRRWWADDGAAVSS